MTKQSWEINNKIKQIFTKNWIDVMKLRINTVKDCVHIKGDLVFSGGKVDNENEVIVAGYMKKVLRNVQRSIKDIKHVKWELNGWEVRQSYWHKKTTRKNKDIEK